MKNWIEVTLALVLLTALGIISGTRVGAQSSRRWTSVYCQSMACVVGTLNNLLPVGTGNIMVVPDFQTNGPTEYNILYLSK